METPRQKKRYSQRDLKQVINELSLAFSDRISLAPAICDQHGQGEDSYGIMAPDAVIYAYSTEEVAEIIRACKPFNIPVIAYGTGTSVEGHLLAVEGGICIDLSEMNQIISVNTADMDCRVQAGVTREELNKALRYDGLFFPIDPGANASLGGMSATRASGTNAVRYGTMREAVLGLTVVTADGEIIKTGGRSRKSSAGYDLTRLFVGSEGTLGIITEIQLRLHPVPETIKSAVCTFDTTESAVNSVIDIMQCAIPVARIELLNQRQMEACIAYSKLEGFGAAPTLFLEFHGSPTTVSEQIELATEICSGHNGNDFRWAESTEERNELWQARHNAYFAAQSLHAGYKVLTTDVCVPISNLARCILEAETQATVAGLDCPIVGHVGDGNFHMLILFDPESAEQQDRARRLSSHIVDTALKLDGTCTGEHGIGIGKKHYLRQEHHNGVDIMAKLKQVLDPNNLLNPGKVIDL